MTEQHTTPPFRLQSGAVESTDMKENISDCEAHVFIEPQAMVGMSNAWQFADIEWKRSLQCRLEDVVYYGLTILPYEELCSLAIEEAFPRAWPMRELQRYLRNSLRCDLYSEYTDEFSNHFCLALEDCCTALERQSRQDEGDRKEKLWGYAPRQMELPCIRQLPCSITDPIKTILEILREYPSLGRSDSFEEDARLWVANRVDLLQPVQTREDVANAGRTISLDALTKAWREEGYHEHLLRRYVWYRMIKQDPSRQDEVNLFVGQLFDKPWETRHWIPTTDRNDESDLRIHRTR